ncbi:MAG: NADH-quinone oxidoreductase subunit N [Elusimicrobiota bacterium]
MNILFLPELIICMTLLVVLGVDLFIPSRHQPKLYLVSLAGVILAFLAVVYLWSSGKEGAMFYQFFLADNFAYFIKALILITVFFVLIISYPYQPLSESKYLAEYQFLLLGATLGMFLLVSAQNLLMIFLALELVGIASYILVGFIRKDVLSNEAAIKYFLIGTFSSGIMIFGMSLFYGLTGDISLFDLGGKISQGPLVIFSLLCITAGLGFKISLVPFHFWAPDAYQGAPTPITAFLSLAPKMAGLAIILRFFDTFIPLDKINFNLLFAFLAAVTMTVGNLMAIQQTNIKRLLAYSSIAQIGYLLVGFVVVDSFGKQGMMVYLTAYLFTNLGAFSCVIAVSNKLFSNEIKDYAGLAHRSLGLALMMFVFLLSLAGLPPMGGFLGKFLVFGSAIKTGYLWLAVFGILNSVVSVYYYFRVVYRMFFQFPADQNRLVVSPVINLVIAVSGIMVLLIGLYPNPLIQLISWWK